MKTEAMPPVEDRTQDGQERHRADSCIRSPCLSKARSPGFIGGCFVAPVRNFDISRDGQSHGRRVRYKPTAHGRAVERAPLPSPFAAHRRFT